MERNDTKRDGCASVCITNSRLQPSYNMQLQQPSCTMNTNVDKHTGTDSVHRAATVSPVAACPIRNMETESKLQGFSLTWGASVTVGGEGARGLGCRPILLQRLLAPDPSLEPLHPALLLRLGGLRVQELLIRIVHAHMLCHQTPVNS